MTINSSARNIFFEEADEHLDILEAGLLELEDGITEADKRAALVDRLFRSAHTLKGASSLLKFNTISEIAHELENLLEGFKSQSVDVTPRLLDAMLAAIDTVRNLLQMVDLPDYHQQATLHGLQSIQMLRAAQGEEDEGKPVASADSGDKTAHLGNSVKVGVDKIDQMMNLLGEMTVTKTHLLEQLGSFENMKEEIDFSRQRLLREVGSFSERYEHSLLNEEQQDRGESLVSDFEELEFDRYDEINLFARKLQEISNDINEAVTSISAFFGQVSVDVEAIDRMTAQMKERISEIRTLPIESLYQRFRRSIRNIASAEEKQVELQLEGGDTRLGRTIIDGLFDPLLHILRNAVAHGIETPQQRRAAGKPECGVIKISTRRRGNVATITVSDDGGGIQFDRIHAKAVALGWIDDDAQLQQQDYIDMLFRPGFTTRDSADDTAGRGVGMDVVIDRLSDLHGSVEVNTEPGRGSEFILNVPLSLVIINVIQFRLGRQLFVLPSSLIEEIQEMAVVDVDADGSYATRQQERYRLVDLNSLFEIDITDASRRCVLFVRTSRARLGLIVEEIVSQEDTVIRPFGKLLADMPCYSGTSVSGGGDVRLVLSPSRLVPIIDSDHCQQKQEPVVATAAVQERKPRVLVVDDSLSVRKYASLILENNGVEVLTATNGLEALGVLDEEQVDLVLSDLEMPVMHGYELLTEIGRREALSNLPVVVITSRAGEQHREKAFDLGAIDYLVKPFNEDELLALISEYTLFTL